MDPSDENLRRVFARTRVIACVGMSPNPVRPSHYVSRYLSLKGFRVIGVNPGHAGKQLFGETLVADVSEAPPETDMIDIFRRSEHVPPIVAAALEALPNLRTVWMQIGIRNAEAAQLAESRGVEVIQDRCPKIEYPRLFPELGTGGIPPS